MMGLIVGGAGDQRLGQTWGQDGAEPGRGFLKFLGLFGVLGQWDGLGPGLGSGYWGLGRKHVYTQPRVGLNLMASRRAPKHQKAPKHWKPRDNPSRHPRRRKARKPSNTGALGIRTGFWGLLQYK